jgi:hypothetical protein
MSTKVLLPALIVSLLINIVFAAIAFLYFQTSAFDFMVVQRGIPKLCCTIQKLGAESKKQPYYQKTCLPDEVDGRYPNCAK